MKKTFRVTLHLTQEEIEKLMNLQRTNNLGKAIQVTVNEKLGRKKK